MRSLDECTCSCHRTGAVHIVACCTGVSKYAHGGVVMGGKDLPLVGEKVDVHAYRPAISKDCIVGTCSINNCLYPFCLLKQPNE